LVCFTYGLFRISSLEIVGLLGRETVKAIIALALICFAPAWAAPTDSITLTDSSTTVTSGNYTPTRVSLFPDSTLLCDFCTDRTIPEATHTSTHVDKNSAAGSPVKGDATLFGMHNLTPSGDNTGEICAFCHTPQGSEDNVSAPRWNRTLTTLSGYRAYSSLGSATQEATGSISMACLSCHDGSQAPNIVINTPTLRLNVGDVNVYIGNALRNHHPVGVQYAGGGQDQNAPDIPNNPVAIYDRNEIANRFATGNKFSPFPSSSSGGYLAGGSRSGSRFFNSRDLDAFSDVLPLSNEGDFDSTVGGFNKSTYSGTGSGTVWWVKTPYSTKKNGRLKTDLYLFTRTDTVDSIPSESVLNRPYVECATCHDPHSANTTFLRIPGGNARSQICLTCHNK